MTERDARLVTLSQLADAPDAALLAEVERRGLTLKRKLCRCYLCQAQRWAAQVAPMRMADGDE